MSLTYRRFLRRAGPGGEAYGMCATERKGLGSVDDGHPRNRLRLARVSASRVEAPRQYLITYT